MSRNGTAVVITLESKFEGFSYGVSKNIRLFCEFIPSLKKITIEIQRNILLNTGSFLKFIIFNLNQTNICFY